MGTIQRQGLINTVIIYVGVVLGFLNRIVVQPYYLSPEEVGMAGLLISFSALLTTFFLLGSSSMCVRYFPVFRNAKKRHHGFFGFMLLFPLAGIVTGGILIALLKRWILARYGLESPLFAAYFEWAFPLAAVMTLSIAINAYSNSLLKTTFPSFLNDIWVRVLLVVVAMVYGMGWITLDWFVAGIGIVYLSQLLLIAAYVFTVDRPGILIDWSFVHHVGFRPIAQFSFLLTLTALSSLSMKFLDSVLIGAYLGEKEVGIYLIGAFIAQFIETPLYSVERIAAIKIAHAFSSGNLDEIREIYYRSVRVLFLAGGFLAVCIITNIHDFLRLLPEDYRDAAGVTIIMSAGSIVNMATGVNSPILNNSSKYIWGVIFLLILLVVSVILNMIFIPNFGIEGAALATGLASALYNLAKFIYIWKKFGMQPYDVRSLKTVGIILLALATGFFAPVPENPWLAMAERGFLITALFAGLGWGMKIVPEYHHLLTSLWGRRK